MHLRSLTLKGFKSFPDRTRLEFGPGVSVVVGPNGSGKSNITDAVLWALGEQSPLAVRGQSMQDVIFGGARGQQARQSAEVELVLDNSDAALDVDWSEISILRRLDRTGEGEYRLNGARCRLVDVIEAMSDTGLGKEMHSVVSQGRVEAVVSSRPRDRRLLIEEAAGLGKHRKRRRRAQLKLERTRENLDRALDVEREARSRLRPLKRQAEAAELHARLERQSLEARWELARDDVRARRAALAEAEAAAAAARETREAIDRALGEVAGRREAAEGALTRRGEQREALAARAFAARAAHERIGMRLEQARVTSAAVEDRIAAGRSRLEALEAEAAQDGAEGADDSRPAALTRELAELERARDAELDEQLAGLERERREAEGALERADAELAQRREALAAAEQASTQARAAGHEAERAADAARRQTARVDGELAAVNHFLRDRGGAGWMGDGVRALSQALDVAPGYEAAVAAVLGGRLAAALVEDRAGAAALLDRAGEVGGSVLVAGAAVAASDAPPPAAGAERLSDRVAGPVAALALLADAWVVHRLDEVSEEFGGVAVTRAGRAWFGASRELRQTPAGGEDRVLAERSRRERLIAEVEAAAGAERAAVAEVEAAGRAAAAAASAVGEAEDRLHATQRERDAVAEEARRIAWIVEQRRAAPDEGPTAVRRARLQAELDAERRLAARAERIREERRARLAAARERLVRDDALAPAATALAGALDVAAAAVADTKARLERELEADRAGGEEVAAELRRCAAEEARLQGDLRARGEQVTTAEVTAQQVRDHAGEAEAELGELAGRLELAAEPADDALEPEQREALAARVQRLARRREQLGPVNPLAEREYEEAREHSDQLEAQRRDLETALRELESLIEETDRRIREAFETTFHAAAANFEEVVSQLFPGGRGRLRLVRTDAGPRPVLGGASAGETGTADEQEPGEQRREEDEDLGVEIEMTPAGKAMKRLSLLSGGEKSLTALAFLFAIFLARPCPFYVLDEVEAALDDLNIDRFLTLLRRYSGAAQFIVVTHQKRTMEAADTLYGVSMGDDGVSRVISRRLPGEERAAAASA